MLKDGGKRRKTKKDGKGKRGRIGATENRRERR